MPESFIPATMLYIRMELNGVKFQAFVDTGAQSTIISKAFAQQCGVLKDVDTRFKGVAVGVGTSAILGRIHSAMLKVDGRHTIECSLQVIDILDMDFLFGIDMMKKHRVCSSHQCLIDLGQNLLRFPHSNFDVPFVKDHEISRGKPAPPQEASGFGFGMSSLMAPSKQDQDKKIKMLTEMGASRTQAEALLKRFGWNADMAAAVYFEANNR